MLSVLCWDLLGALEEQQVIKCLATSPALAVFCETDLSMDGLEFCKGDKMAGHWDPGIHPYPFPQRWDSKNTPRA